LTEIRCQWGEEKVGRGQHLLAVRVRVALYLVYSLLRMLSLTRSESERVHGKSSFASGVVLDMAGVPSIRSSAAFLGTIRVRRGRLRGVLCEWLARLRVTLRVTPGGLRLFWCERMIPLASIGYRLW